jgi:hypothetical protein
VEAAIQHRNKELIKKYDTDKSKSLSKSELLTMIKAEDPDYSEDKFDQTKFDN